MRISAIQPFDAGAGTVLPGAPAVEVDDDVARELIDAGVAEPDDEGADAAAGSPVGIRIWADDAGEARVLAAIRIERAFRDAPASALDDFADTLAGLPDRERDAFAALSPDQAVRAPALLEAFKGVDPDTLPQLAAIAGHLTAEQLTRIAGLSALDLPTLMAVVDERLATEAASAAAERAERIRSAAAGMDRDDKSLWTADGEPKVAALEAASGLQDVTADERDTAWAAVKGD